jgi:D-lyxose ketol-isomerase
MLYNATPDNTLAENDVRVNMDGVWRTLPAGTTIALKPGESITITPRLYHRFWAEGERVLMGEVSSVNDDLTDNSFYHLIGTGRFSEVEEDAPPLYPLANEYARFWQAARESD